MTTEITVKKFTYAIFALLGLLAFESPAHAAQLTKFTFAGDSWPGFAPIWVAEKEHFFKGIEFKYINMESGRDALLLAGKLDSTNLSMNQVIENYRKGYKTPIVLPMDYSDGADAILADKSIKSVKMFKGQKIALNTMSYSELLLLGALKHAGLNLHDVSQVNMEANAVPTALMSHTVKVGVTWQPNVSVALSKDKNVRVIFSSHDVPGLVTDNIVFAEGYAKAHPMVVKHIIEGYLAGLKFIKTHPEAAYRIMGDRMGVSPKLAKSIYLGVHNVTLPEMKTMFSGMGAMSYKVSIGDVLQVMKFQKEVPMAYSPDWKMFVDPHYVDAMTHTS